MYAADFATADAAAVAVLTEAMPQSACVEWAGAIFESNGRYTFTPPARGDKGSFRIAVRVTVGQRLVAIYHTHPACNNGDASAFFSPQDIATANKLKIPSYIGVAADASIRKFDPGHSMTVAYNAPGSAFTWRIAPGLVIGHGSPLTSNPGVY